jgi:hypothetical protein
VVVGFAMVVLGVFGPWQEMLDPVGFTEMTNGVSGGDAPGLQVLVFAAATALVCALPAVAGSRTRSVQLLPALGGAFAFIVAVRSYLAVAPKDIWDPSQSSQVVVEWGMWSVLAGSALIALGGLAITLIIVRDRPLAPELGEPKADLSFVRPLVGAVIGFVLAVAGVELVVPLLPPAYQQATVPLLFVGTVLAAVGIYRLLGLPAEAATARRRRISARIGHDMPEPEPLQRQPRR